MSVLVPRERIEQTILLIHGHNVMLDSDLAQLYGVTVGRLNEAVKRNKGWRFQVPSATGEGWRNCA